jgi:hypothetical protein
MALAELDAPGVVLDHDGSVLQLERLLLSQVAQGRERALRSLLTLIADSD